MATIQTVTYCRRGEIRKPLVEYLVPSQALDLPGAFFLVHLDASSSSDAVLVFIDRDDRISLCSSAEHIRRSTGEEDHPYYFDDLATVYPLRFVENHDEDMQYWHELKYFLWRQVIDMLIPFEVTIPGETPLDMDEYDYDLAEWTSPDGRRPLRFRCRPRRPLFL